MMELCDQEAKKSLGKPQVSGVVSSQHLVLEDYHMSVWKIITRVFGTLILPTLYM